MTILDMDEIIMMHPDIAVEMNLVSNFDYERHYVERRNGLVYPAIPCDQCKNIGGWVKANLKHLMSAEHVALSLGTDVQDLKRRDREFTRWYTLSKQTWLQNRLDAAVAYKGFGFLDGRLISQHQNYEWFPDTVMEARCYTTSPMHKVPGSDCSCGFYSMWRYQEVRDTFTYYGPVVAQVKIGGKVIAGPEGAISQYALITKIVHIREDREIIALALHDEGYKIDLKGDYSDEITVPEWYDL